MSATEYLRLLRSQWPVILLVTVACLVAAYFYTATRTPIYQADTQLFVRVSSASKDVSQLAQGSAFIQQQVKSYADIVTNPYVLDDVISELTLPYSADELEKMISVESPLNTVLLNVSVKDKNPDQAQQIANAVDKRFATFVQDLETPPGVNAVSTVKIATIRPATTPGAQVSPSLPLNLALALVLGLGLGAGTAALRRQLNTKLTDSTDIEKITGSLPLGVVPFDASAASQPLVGEGNNSSRAEALRALRTNLQFTNVDDPPRVIVLTSALPGDGKTTTACNLALTIALGGSSVVLVEGDLRKPAIGRYMGISSSVGLTDVLSGKHALADVLMPVENNRLVVLPSGPPPPNPSELLGSQQMAKLVNELAADFDFVIIDAPPLLPVTDAAVLAAVSDGALLIARHGRTERDELTRAVQSLGAVNATLIGTVLNCVPPGKKVGYDGYGYGPAATTARPSTRPRAQRPERPAQERSQNGVHQRQHDVFPVEGPTRPVPPTRRRDR